MKEPETKAVKTEGMENVGIVVLPNAVSKPGVEAGPAKVEKTSLKSEEKVDPAKAEKSISKPETKAEPAKAEKTSLKSEEKVDPTKAEKSTSKPEEKAEPAKVEKTSLKSEVKAEPAKAEKSTSKPEAKAEPTKAEKSTSKPEAKVDPAKAEKSTSKPEAKAEPAKAEKSTSKPEAKAELAKVEKSTSKPEAPKTEKTASQSEAKVETPKAGKPASKPEAKAEAPVQAVKPEASAGEKAAHPIASVNPPAVPNPPAISEKPTVQVVDSPLRRMKQEFTERTNVIKQEMRNIQNSFLVIGFQLHWIKNNNMYRVLDYKNIMDYAEKEFGIKKSTCCNFINIIETYAERDGNGEVIESIAECYRNFSSSQLLAMIGMPEEMQQQVTPDMSVRAITRLRKGEPEQPVVDAPKAVISGARPAESLPVREVPKADVPVHEISKPAVSAPVHGVPKPLGTANGLAANNIGKPLANHVPRTLLEIESYSGYRSVAGKIDKLVKEAFSGGKQMKLKLVCEEG
ncbi:MAG: hypothetical protein HFI44_16245 [Lachnospiraceae bacterium]|nr:hypothetical protein [Lachnospiraceae bacterium]